MRKALFAILAVPLLFLWQSAGAATILFEQTYDDTTADAGTSSASVDSVYLDPAGAVTHYSDWMPLIVSVFSAEQNKFVDVVPDSFLFNFMASGNNTDNDSVHVQVNIQTSENKSVFSSTTLYLDSMDVKTPGDNDYVWLTARMARSQFTTTVPLAKWGRLVFTSTFVGGAETWADSTWIHMPIRYKALGTTTPNGAVAVINQQAISSALTIADSGGTAVYSDWFPLYTKVYSQAAGGMVDVCPNEFFFTVKLTPAATGGYGTADSLAMNMKLQTSEDKSTLSDDLTSVYDLDNVGCTAATSYYYGGEFTRSVAGFPEGTPMAKWGRLQFTTDSDQTMEVTVATIDYRGMVTDPVQNNMIQNLAVYGGTTGVATDTITVAADGSAAYSNWFPLEVLVPSFSRNKSVRMVPDEWYFTVKVRDIDADGNPSVDLYLQTSDDRVEVSDVNNKLQIDDTIAADTDDGGYVLIGGRLSRSSFSDVAPLCKWGRIVFTNDGDSDLKSVHEVKVRGFVTTPTQ